MLKNSKFAMTLGELLVVFVIMGVIATLTLVTAKPGDKSLKYVYHRMYHSIDTALYNSSIGMSEDLRNEIYETNKQVLADGEELVGNDKQFPSMPSQLCKMLIEYINTKGEDNCSAADTTAINANNPDFSVEPHFIASNGTKVWMGYSNRISSKYFYNDNTYSNSLFDLEIHTRFAHVFVDLNGDMGPNSPIQRGDRMTDIVGFAITKDLDVVPIGAPITDTRYFSTRVVYANKAAKDSENLITSSPMSFLQARRLAWAIERDNYKDISSQNWDYPMSINNIGLKCDSPFYVGYTQSMAGSNPLAGGLCNSIPNGITLNDYNEITSQTIDDDCTRLNDTGAKVVDYDACYLEIKDYY